MSSRAVAEELGISYSMLMNACNPDLPEFHLRAGALSMFAKLTGGRLALDWLEASVGRIAIDMPEAPANLDDVQAELYATVKEFGDMVQVSGRALMDGRIDGREAKRIERETLEMIRQAHVFLSAVQARAEV